MFNQAQKNSPMSRNAARPSVSKSDQVVTDCLYQIATGSWKPGHHLPSLREATKTWGINGLTCLRAYRRLIALGLVVSRERGGYFVADSTSVTRLNQHQTDVQLLYRHFESAVRKQTCLPVLGAARAVAQLAEIRAEERPEVAFVECTRYQAEGHAREVSTRLHIPCIPLTTHDLAGKRDRLPPEIRFVLTTHFHGTELAILADPPRLFVKAVPIEMSPVFVSSLASANAQEIVVLGLKGPMAKAVKTDLAKAIKRKDLVFRSRETDETELPEVLSRQLGDTPVLNSKRIVVLSTTLWSIASDRWKNDPRVHPYDYQLTEDAWADVASLLGTPLLS